MILTADFSKFTKARLKYDNCKECNKEIFDNVYSIKLFNENGLTVRFCKSCWEAAEKDFCQMCKKHRSMYICNSSVFLCEDCYCESEYGDEEDYETCCRCGNYRDVFDMICDDCREEEFIDKEENC
jgi:hypothetical protein